MITHATRRTGIEIADSRAAETRATAPVLVAIFIASLLLPIQFEIGGQRLSPYRLFLLLTFVPLSLRWITGRSGGITPGDVLICLYCLWTGFALLMVHGAARIPFAGIITLELFGGYLAGRTLMRNAADHRLLFRYMLVTLVLLAPFALIEAFTGRQLITELFDPIFSTLGRATGGGGEMRLGMHRVQSVFDHSILFGLFCSVAIANVFYIYRESLGKSLFLSGFATAMTFLSLSSAALLAAGMQFALILWGRMTANAWRILVVLFAVSYVAVDLASNRTPVTILISNLTLNPASAWTRIRIWEYGIAEVWRHPLFGIGLNDWQRGWGMSSSVDNFWLLTTMRAGIPAFLLLVTGLVANLVRILRADLPPDPARYRIGYVIAAVSIFMTLCTVHMWGSASVFLMFYFGAGLWFVNAVTESPTRETPARDGARLRPAPPRQPAATAATARSRPVSGHPEGGNHRRNPSSSPRPNTRSN